MIVQFQFVFSFRDYNHFIQLSPMITRRVVTLAFRICTTSTLHCALEWRNDYRFMRKLFVNDYRFMRKLFVVTANTIMRISSILNSAFTQLNFKKLYLIRFVEVFCRILTISQKVVLFVFPSKTNNRLLYKIARWWRNWTWMR